MVASVAPVSVTQAYMTTTFLEAAPANAGGLAARTHHGHQLREVVTLQHALHVFDRLLRQVGGVPDLRHTLLVVALDALYSTAAVYACVVASSLVCWYVRCYTCMR